ncbi:MAG TPA: hypothetical protein VGQ17_01580 [Gemmatimonadales bacterium]|jgi:hypothetical protein|nr:hypothetical protein [Gemmatimonadales bacterium]
MATGTAFRMPVGFVGAALLALMACGSGPKAPPAPAPPAAIPPASAAAQPSPPPAPASVAPVADTTDTTPTPVNSPDSSVRRWKLDEVVTGRAPTANECEGDACGAVSVTWLEPGYRFENLGLREVAITIWFALKGDCLRARFSLAPAKTSGWGNTGFCKPYRADYQ